MTIVNNDMQDYNCIAQLLELPKWLSICVNNFRL